MKKYITRLMAMVLTLATMFTLFAVPASAAMYTAKTAGQVTVDGKVEKLPTIRLMDTHVLTDADKNTFTDDEFLHDKDFAAISYYLETRYSDHQNIPYMVTDLNKLAQYMPHVSSETRNALKCLPYDGGTNTTLYAYTDKNTAMTYSQRNETLKAQARHQSEIGPAYQLGNLTNLFREYLNQELDLLARGQIITSETKQVSVNASVENSANTFFYDSFSTSMYSTNWSKLWISGSGQNDTTIHHVLLGDRTYYYGADTFRNSALETVVFPAGLLSDHYMGMAVDTKALKSNTCFTTLRTVSGMFLGKEAIVLADHAFADNVNLKSVIFPTEPARLYFEDGVFSNCPDLTVYAPAGGYIESYCKTNGIKFQAIANGYIEPKLTGTPTILTFDHIEYDPDSEDVKYCLANGIDLKYANANIGYFDFKPISNYAPDFANAFAVTRDNRAIINQWVPGCALPKDCLPTDKFQDALGNDINRYRADRDGQFVNGVPWFTYISLNCVSCWL